MTRWMGKVYGKMNGCFNFWGLGGSYYKAKDRQLKIILHMPWEKWLFVLGLQINDILSAI